MERYLAKQLKNPVKAIHEFCIECMGGRGNTGYSALIKECASKDCSLYDFRFGENPYRSERTLSADHKRALIYAMSNDIPPENPSTRMNN